MQPRLFRILKRELKSSEIFKRGLVTESYLRKLCIIINHVIIYIISKELVRVFNSFVDFYVINNTYRSIVVLLFKSRVRNIILLICF